MAIHRTRSSSTTRNVRTIQTTSNTKHTTNTTRNTNNRNLQRTNTELEEVFNSSVAVYTNWHDSFIDSDLDNQVYYWYSEDEFWNLKLGQKLDDDTIYLVDIDHEGCKMYQLELHEEEVA